MSGSRSARATLSVAAVAISATVAAAADAQAYRSAGPVQASVARTATVRLARTSKGKILVNSRGFTLYMFTADRRNSDHCVKVSGCTSIWPPLTVRGRPTAGTGVKVSLLHTITLSGGRKQVTYNGHPLYRYTGDSSPRSTFYLGFSSFGGRWYGVNANGHAVR